MEHNTAVQARVMGRVQGVAFRAWTRGAARARGLRGWVRNNGDGSVSALVMGPEDKVREMTDLLWTGPGAASVRDVSCTHVAPEAGCDPFEIRR